jgi:quercetin dioxygenase-like cupin family protein
MSEKQPVVIRGATAELYEGGAGVVATVLVDPQSTGVESLAFGHISFASGASVPPHTRDVEEFIYVIEGVATIVACGEKFVLRSGDAIYLPAGTEHQHINEGPESLRQIYVFSPAGPEQGVRQWPLAADADVR